MKTVFLFLALISYAHADDDCSKLLSKGERIQISIRDLSELRYELDLRQASGSFDLTNGVLEIAYRKKFDELLALEPKLETKIRAEVESIQRERAVLDARSIQKSIAEKELVENAYSVATVIGKTNDFRNESSQIKLASGKILIFGGRKVFTVEANLSNEEFDPATGKSRKRADLPKPFLHSQFSLLNDDTVLMTGGIIAGESSKEISVFNPRKNKFERVGELKAARSNHAQVTLPNGKVLIMGGLYYASYSPGVGAPVSVIELFDPVTRTSEVIANEAALASNPVSELLSNGTVLVNNGQVVYLIDPVQKKVSRVAELQQPRAHYAQSMMLDGRLFISGGVGAFGVNNNLFLRTTEIVDLNAKTSEFSEPLFDTRCYHQQITLPDGGVAMIGGLKNFERNNGRQLVEVFDPKFVYVRPIEFKDQEGIAFTRVGHRLFLEKDGSVIMIGGNRREADGTLREVEKIVLTRNK